MKFSERWLREWVNPSLDTAALCETLTMTGLEVEECDPAGQPLPRVVVAEILSAEKHPNADRLRVCSVNTGEASPRQIVCGAPNARVGIKVPCALDGAELPGGLVIKPTTMRGVESQGMLCSAKELLLSDASEGLLELPADAPVGQALYDYLLLDDSLITIKLTPNRADCLSIEGVARDVAAVTGATMTPAQWVVPAVTTDAKRGVRIDSPEGCGRYCGRVIEGVNPAAPTPAWMVQRLTRAGVRSISALVDVTNYVMLELGQPLHAFDQAKLQGEVGVRWARNGETLTLLNGKEIVLEPDMLLITDASGPVALAGVMGGQATEVSDGTTDVFLESAFFHPSAVAGRARRLGFVSEASHRFERGVDFALAHRALERATQLVLEICGGKVGAVSEATGSLPARHAVNLRFDRLNRVLGTSFARADVSGLLSRLGLNVFDTPEGFQVTPPSYRFDLAIEEDLIEEVARVYGYDRIEPVLPAEPQAMLPVVEARRSRNDLLGRLIARDYQQVITFSFVEERWENELSGCATPLKLLNPIASQLSVMRTSLVGGLIEALRTNLARKQSRVRLVEVGRVFLPKGREVEQPERLGGLAYGLRLPEQWGAEAGRVDFFDVKGDLEALVLPHVLTARKASHPACHPGRSADLWLGERRVGWIGELHPQWVQTYDLPEAPVLFELDVAALADVGLPAPQAVSKFPPVRRDLAVVVDAALPAQQLLDSLRAVAPASVTELALFDVYAGKGIEPGKKSLALRIMLHDTQKTLTDEEVDNVMSALVAEASTQHGAQLRN